MAVLVQNPAHKSERILGRLRHDGHRSPVSGIPCSRYLRFCNRVADPLDQRSAYGHRQPIAEYVHAKHDAARNERVQEAEAYTA
jgi:hypothetical protein